MTKSLADLFDSLRYVSSHAVNITKFGNFAQKTRDLLEYRWIKEPERNMPERPKKLYRSRTDKMLAGVCGGLGEYFKLDPIIFRGIFLVLLMPGGFGLLLYLLLAILVPNKPRGEGVSAAAGEEVDRDFAVEIKDRAEELAREVRGRSGWLKSPRNLLGLLLVVLGFFVLLNQLFPQSWLRWNFLWPVVLIVIGLMILTKRNKD